MHTVQTLGIDQALPTLLSTCSRKINPHAYACSILGNLNCNKETPEKIVRHCSTGQRFAKPPIRFKMSLPTEENLLFCDELSIDLMVLNGKSVLQIVDTATYFYVATFLYAYGANYGQSIEAFALAFLMAQGSTYSGYPSRLLTYHRWRFVYDRWK